MTKPGPRQAELRPVRLLAAGGTIAMRGEQAIPALNADELIEQLPQLASGPPLQTETVLALPSAQLSLNALAQDGWLYPTVSN